MASEEEPKPQNGHIPLAPGIPFPVRTEFSKVYEKAFLA